MGRDGPGWEAAGGQDDRSVYQGLGLGGPTNPSRRPPTPPNGARPFGAATPGLMPPACPSEFAMTV